MMTITEMPMICEFAQEPMCTEALHPEMNVTQPGLLVNA